MTTFHARAALLTLSLALALSDAAQAASIHHPDHYEFDATLNASFAPSGGGFPITLFFDYPSAGDATAAAWVLEAVAPNGRIVHRWQGVEDLRNQRGILRMAWNGRDQHGRLLPAGYYTLRLRAAPTVKLREDALRTVAQRVSNAFATFTDEIHVQQVDVMIGRVAPARVPAIRPLAVGVRQDAGALRATKAVNPRAPSAVRSVAGTSGLPYTIYYGNLHSQTNHSDGGTALASCSGSESPQAGEFGPSEAYAMMHTQAGGDFLLASEHNHMYDGSTGTNTSASPATANALFNSGLLAASNYTAANPTFLGLYGSEWGVISNGGHLNLINPDVLAGWETNSSGQLIGSVATPKSDYATLYSTMLQRGWIGQFNHPSSSQFAIGGTGMAYSSDGAEVMVLAEILNSSAFSTNTSQTETSRSSYTGAWNLLLERGYKVAPASNQDNHCANWGLSFTNRTGVLLPTGTALTQANFVTALRARRAFATEDKTGQLILTANGHVMGETFTNSGALTLTANYASTSGQTVQRVQFFEGVPGRNGTVTQLSEGNGTHTFTPGVGQHFYYALITQANGLRLWSAPIWVAQQTASSDTTPPTVNAGVSGTTGIITLSATATDNVGVSNVEFYIDGVLRGSDSSEPYAMAFDSASLTRGNHSLTAKAIDTAGNSTISAPVAFSIGYTAPIANFSTSISALTASFIDMSFDIDDNIASRTWNFGDGTSSTTVNPSHTYAVAGTYTVVLTVTDSIGLTHSKSQVVNVGSNVAQTYSNTTDVAIVDKATVTSSITVSGRAGNAPNATPVEVRIVHTYIGDLKVDLIAPDGSVYILRFRSGGSADNIYTTYSVNLPTEAINGTWKLRVNDNASGDTGYIDSWGLTF